MIKVFSLFSNPNIAHLAAKTPASRDRYVDFLRAFSICVVVVGHWISGVILWEDSGIRIHNAVGMISGTWATTWILQVMPLFFFVGGFSNLVSLDSSKRRRESTYAFLRTRATRLLRPTSIFLAVWFLVLVVLFLLFEEDTRYTRGAIMILGPLWFLGVYLMVIMITPMMRELHRRYRVGVLIVLVLLTILVDLLRFWLKLPLVHWTNVAFVWIFVHQLGFFYGDGSLLRTSKWVYLAMASGGLAGLTVLTNIGVYSRSMVGTGVERVSNMNPPTVCIVVLTCWLVGAAMLLRDRLNRWLSHQRPWITVIAANSMIMTLYLWHLSAYAIAFFLLFGIGLGRQAAGTPYWWLERPAWVIVPASFLFVLLGIFGRFERSV